MESFHGKLRDECLNEEIFWSRAEAQVVLDWYRDVYNRERPHRSLGYRTPAEAAVEAANGAQNYLSTGSQNGVRPGGASGAAPDEIAKVILTTIANDVLSEIANSEVDRLIKDQLDDSISDKAKGLLDKVGN